MMNGINPLAPNYFLDDTTIHSYLLAKYLCIGVRIFSASILFHSWGYSIFVDLLVMISYKKFQYNIDDYYFDGIVQDAHSTHTVEYVAENYIEMYELKFHWNETK